MLLHTGERPLPTSSYYFFPKLYSNNVARIFRRAGICNYWKLTVDSFYLILSPPLKPPSYQPSIFAPLIKNRIRARAFAEKGED